MTVRLTGLTGQTESDSDILQELPWSLADPAGANLPADGLLTDWLKKLWSPAARAPHISGKQKPLEVAGEAGRGWRARGRTPSPGLHSGG